MRIVILSTALSVSLFSMTLDFSKSFYIEIKPDTLQANISIKVVEKSEIDVTQTLGKYSTFINKTDDIEKKGGNYTVYPKYSYENNRRYKNGYIGNMNYTISSKDSDKLNNFLKKLYTQKSKESVDISTSSLSWVMSKKQKENKIDALRLDAMLWGNSYAKTLSDSLSKKCTLTQVSFSKNSDYYPTPMMREMSMDKSSAPTPTQDMQKIRVNPTFKLECK